MVCICRRDDLKADSATKVASDVTDKSGGSAGTVPFSSFHRKIASFECYSTTDDCSTHATVCVITQLPRKFHNAAECFSFALASLRNISLFQGIYSNVST